MAGNRIRGNFFTVEGAGPVPPSREQLMERLREYAFREAAAQVAPEKLADGWCSIRQMLDVSFEDSTHVFLGPGADILRFGFRTDKRMVPGALVRATVEKQASAWCRDHGAERCPAAMKRQIKDEIVADFLRRAIPRISMTNVVYRPVEGKVWFDTFTASEVDRFRKRFFRCFGVKLVPVSPLDSLDEGLTHRVLSASPSSFVAASPSDD